MKQLNWTKLGFIGDGLFFLALAFGFALQSPWVTWLWDWSDAPMTYVFLAALLASYGAGSMLMVWLEEWGAAIGGSIAVAIAFGGFAITAVVIMLSDGGFDLAVHAAVMAVIAILAIGTAFTGLNGPSKASCPLPRGLRRIYFVLAPLLFLIGIELILHLPAILPWPLTWQTSLLLGWILIGFAFNYAYVALRGDWAAGQVILFGFLVYDIVIIVPFLLLGETIEGEDFQISLVINLGIVILSALLAIFYLFIDRTTRLGTHQDSTGS